MTILGHGIDIVCLDRFTETLQRQGDTFKNRIFTASEIAYCQAHKDPIPHYAARFAAREAYAKAIGLGLGASGDLNELEVENAKNGAPQMKLHGRALNVFQSNGGKKILLSLSHDGNFAIASVLIVGE